MCSILPSASAQRAHRSTAGFSLTEAMIGMGVLALFVGVCFSSIVFNRTASLKAKEEAIAMDFLMHYCEMVKGLPFSNVAPGQPINPIFNGTAGSPNIIIPNDSSWVSVNTPDFQTFHPDLLWLQTLNPQMQVTLTTQSVGGGPHDTHLNVKLAWDSPLGHGRRMMAQLDLVRTKDL